MFPVCSRYRSAGGDEFSAYLGAHTLGDAIVAAVDAPFGPHLASVERGDRLLSRELRRHFGSRASEFRSWKQRFHLRRVGPKASNQAMQQTAGRSALKL
jgi:hypothetical protein